MGTAAPCAQHTLTFRPIHAAGANAMQPSTRSSRGKVVTPPWNKRAANTQLASPVAAPSPHRPFLAYGDSAALGEDAGALGPSPTRLSFALADHAIPEDSPVSAQVQKTPFLPRLENTIPG